MIKHLLTRWLKSLALMMSLWLIACTDQQAEIELQQTLKAIRYSIQPNQPAPITLKTYPDIHYTEAAQHNPFKTISDARNQSSSRSVSDNRHISPVNTANTIQAITQTQSSLKLIGILRFSHHTAPIALIEDKEGTLHQIRPGSPIGKHLAQVTAISTDTLYIEEKVRDEQGRWISRTSQLKLTATPDR